MTLSTGDLQISWVQILLVQKMYMPKMACLHIKPNYSVYRKTGALLFIHKNITVKGEEGEGTLHTLMDNDLEPMSFVN